VGHERDVRVDEGRLGGAQRLLPRLLLEERGPRDELVREAFHVPPQIVKTDPDAATSIGPAYALRASASERSGSFHIARWVSTSRLAPARAATWPARSPVRCTPRTSSEGPPSRNAASLSSRSASRARSSRAGQSSVSPVSARTARPPLSDGPVTRTP